jgi:hypothetical protein
MRQPAAWVSVILAFAIGCHGSAAPEKVGAAATTTAKSAETSAAKRPGVPPVPGGMKGKTLKNRYAYIPPQCYTKTQSVAGGRASNPCYACHQRSAPPNYNDDADLQLSFKLPGTANANPWKNLFDPPSASGARASDADVLAYVRQSNYFDDHESIALAAKLDPLAPEWDGEGDGHWSGYVPDAYFHFDDRGFDRGPGDRETGWRAFAYYPFLGTFFPTNGAMDDVLIRLDPSLREDASGKADRKIYEINLAIVESLIARQDIPIEPADETTLGVDLDLDGTLGRATRVAFHVAPDGTTHMHYVGRARAHETDGQFPIVPGLFPLGTEFLHSVRYLDVTGSGAVTMANRMKELRYAKKVRWLAPRDLKALAASEAVEQAESATGAREVLWEFDRGVYNGQGWLMQGFIEAADGSLRPQSYEESVFCVGCHGGIGATTDSMFAFPRKLGAASAAGGWFHWSQHDLAGVPEPRRRDGQGEYALYLQQNGAGNEFRDNGEVRAKFFDAQGRLRQEPIARLRRDVTLLLLPSAARALDLDRAYRAIVLDQSFWRGRDSTLAPTANVYTDVPIGQKTGVEKPIVGSPLLAANAVH